MCQQNLIVHLCEHFDNHTQKLDINMGEGWLNQVMINRKNTL